MTDGVTTTLTSAFTSIVGNITDVLGVVLPLALGVLGTVIAVRFAIRWFRSIVG